MSKVKKVIIILAVIFIIILMLVQCTAQIFFGDSIRFDNRVGTLEPYAKTAAKEYIRKKYGEEPESISDARPAMVAFDGDDGWEECFGGVFLTVDGYNVAVYFNGDSVECIYDDRQYTEICNAVEEAFFNDSELGSSYKFDKFYITFSETHNRFTNIYFNGDLYSFAQNSGMSVYADITYEGYPEKSRSCRALLRNKFKRLNIMFTGAAMHDVCIFIHDPRLDLPEAPNKDHNYNLHNKVFGKDIRNPMYEDYMELMAYGRNEKHIYQTIFYDIDEYTAISYELETILSKKDFVFEPVSLGEKSTAYGNDPWHYDHDVPLEIRETGYYIECRGEEASDVMLRFDREHYNITDTTIPLLVRKSKELYRGKMLYTSLGYGDYDSCAGDWHYLDDKYLYVYISGSTFSYDWGKTYLTFSDPEMPV